MSILGVVGRGTSKTEMIFSRVHKGELRYVAGVDICISLSRRQLAEEMSFMTDYRVQAGEAQEDQVTAMIEKYTAPVPSSIYLGLALVSIAASVTLQLTQKEKANSALFVGQWVAPFLLLGVCNKVVKQHG